MAYCSKTETNTSPPKGCTIITVSDKCEVHLLLKGLIDPEKEITKMQKKLDFLIGTINKLNQAVSAADYSIKVPTEVQQANAEKLTQTSIEMKRIEEAMEALKLI